jgi:hypothetical protein
MPIIAVLGAFLFVVLVAIVLVPISLIQRYRIGTSRQLARGWLTAINVMGLALSAAMFLAGAALTNVWVPQAFSYTLAGLGAGGVLGLAGLGLTRWEHSPRALYYTPNRWLVLGLTVMVAGRILYGFWRAWNAWSLAIDRASWAAESGVAGSLAAGAVVLGYYLTYWLGVRRRFKRHR